MGIGADGIAEADAPPAVIVDHSTVSPEATRRIAARVREACGAAWVDAPVSGGLAGAASGRSPAFAFGTLTTLGAGLLLALVFFSKGGG